MTIAIPTRKIWTRQPQVFAGVDWSNPITRGLKLLFPLNKGTPDGLVDLVSGAKLIATTPPSEVVTTKGKARYINNSISVSLTLPGGAPDMTKPWTLFGIVASAATSSTQFPVGFGFDNGTSLNRIGAGFNNNFFKVVANAETPGVGSPYVANQLYAVLIESDGTTIYLWDDGAFDYSVTPTGTKWKSSTNLTIGTDWNSALTGTLTGPVSTVARIDRRLSSNEKVSLLDNPWQLFRP